MKKLMTMIAAVGMAFGLFADVDPFVSGTNFNGMAVGAFTGNEETGLWIGIPQTDNQNKIAAVAWTAALTDMQPEEFALDGAGKSLAVKTTLGTPITRKCNAAGTGIDIDSYVDMMAQFTVFDETPDFTATGYADSKIALWLQESTNTTGDVTGTNVWLYAGKFGGTADSYNCGAVSKYKLGDWNRVTIKSIVDIGDNSTQAFVAFINGIPLEMAEGAYNVGTLPAGASASATVWYNQRKLFPSIVNEQKVSSVSFDGQGGIDDIVFSTLADATHRAFAMDPAVYTIAWDSNKMKDVMTNGVAVSGTSPVIVSGTAPATMNISWTGLGKWASGSQTGVAKDADGNFDLTKSITVDEADATFGGKSWTITDAVAKANAATEDGILTLLKNVDAISIDNENDKVITINLGGFALTGSEDNSTIDAQSAVVVSNGTVTAATEQSAIYGDDVTIYGGTFNGEISGEGIEIFDGVFNGTVAAAATTVIHGGHFLASANAELAEAARFDDGKTLVVDPADESYLIVGDEANYVAQIGNDKYETIDAAWNAFKAAKVDATITVLKDANITCEKWAGNIANFTLDLGGHTLTATNTNEKYVFQFLTGAYTVTVKNGKINTVAHTDGSDTLATVFQNYANLVVEDLEIDAANFGTNKYSDKAGNIFAVMYGNVEIKGDTSIKNNRGYALTIGNHTGNVYSQDGRTVKLNTTGTLGGDFRFCGGKVTYVQCGFSEGAKFYYGSAWTADGTKTDADMWSIYEDGDLIGFPYVARVGITPVLPTVAENLWYKYCGEFCLTLDAAIAAAKAGDEVAVFKDVAQDTVTIASGTATTLAISDEATLTVNMALTLNGAKVALAEGCELVVPAALDKSTDFVTPALGKEIKVSGEGPFTYTLGDVDPTVIDPKTIPEGTKVSDIFKDVPANLANADAKAFAAWCQGKAKQGSSSVGEAGAEAKLDAFLLDCGNSDAQIAEAQKNFKVTGIAQDAEGKWVITPATGDTYGNGEVEVKSYSDVGCEIESEDGNFFKLNLALPGAAK